MRWLKDRNVSQPLNKVDLMALLNASQYVQNHVGITKDRRLSITILVNQLNLIKMLFVMLFVSYQACEM